MSRVLLADDNPQALRLGEQILKAQGLEVVSVSDGAVALRRLEDVQPDLCVIDVFLPTKNGFDLARYMKSQAAFRDIPVVFAATVAETFDEQDAKNAGAEAILRKPFEASSFLSTVQTLLEKRSQALKNAAPSSSSEGLDRHTIRAAVTLALDSAMPQLINELTERVVLALSAKR